MSLKQKKVRPRQDLIAAGMAVINTRITVTFTIPVVIYSSSIFLLRHTKVFQDQCSQDSLPITTGTRRNTKQQSWHAAGGMPRVGRGLAKIQ